MEVSDSKRLRALEDKNCKLKRLLADAMLDVSTLREMLGKTYDLPRPGKVGVPSWGEIVVLVGERARQIPAEYARNEDARASGTAANLSGAVRLSDRA